MLAGKRVQGPATAYAEAVIIKINAEKGSGGRTFAEISDALRGVDGSSDEAQKLRNQSSALSTGAASATLAFGTAAEGAVLSTASGAAFRGMKVILPVDGMSSATPYGEQSVAWIMLHSPGTAAATTATSAAMISFK